MMFTIIFLHPGLAEAGRESGEMLRQMKELSASARAANHIRKVRYTVVIQIPATKLGCSHCLPSEQRSGVKITVEI